MVTDKIITALEETASDTDVNKDSENRKEPRYSCIRLPVFYSVVNGQNLTDIRKKLYNAAIVDMSLSGLAFDIEQAMLSGEKLLIYFDSETECDNTEIMTIVRRCKALPSGQYRIGVVIDE